MSRLVVYALLASTLPWGSGCLSDLSVGLSPLEGDDAPSTTDDVQTADAARPSDAGLHDAAPARDANALDARASGDAASCENGRCGAGSDASARDAAARDANVADAVVPRDTGTADAASDARVADAAIDPCVPSDCQYVGLVHTLITCEGDVAPECRLNDDDVCDLQCPEGILIRKGEDASIFGTGLTSGDGGSTGVQDSGEGARPDGSSEVGRARDD